jgi:RecA-family ATPase
LQKTNRPGESAMEIKEVAAFINAMIEEGPPGTSGAVVNCMKRLPENIKNILLKAVYEKQPEADNYETENKAEIMSGDQIMNQVWPEPRWAIDKLLPVGLAIIAGAPKIGKSWFGLQLAHEVARGGRILGFEALQGKVFYAALEDLPRRLKDRMIKQRWEQGLPAEFLTLDSYAEVIGDLAGEGCQKLTEMIEERDYRLVIIDTLSRAIGAGDQNEVEEMTNLLKPLQAAAHRQNSVIVMIDHHNKAGGFGRDQPDAIGDILGSTAKGAVADTVIGMYRERNKAGARFALTGRDVEETLMDIRFNAYQGIWEIDGGERGLTQQQLEVLNVMEDLKGPEGVAEIAVRVGRNRGSVHKQLAELESMQKIQRVMNKWEVIRYTSQGGGG